MVQRGPNQHKKEGEEGEEGLRNEAKVEGRRKKGRRGM